jgi:hypothetical protein
MTKIQSLEPSKMGEVELEERNLRRELNGSLSKLQLVVVDKESHGRKVLLNLGHLERK